MVGGGLLAAVIAALVFRVFQPYAFAGPGFFDLRLNPRWLDNIAYQAKTQDGSVDLPPSIQWAGTTPLLFPWRHMVAWGLGIPLGLAAWGGFAGPPRSACGGRATRRCAGTCWCCAGRRSASSTSPPC